MQMTEQQERDAAKRRLHRQLAKASLPRVPRPVAKVPESFAVVTSHYNFAGFKAMRRNLHRFMLQMDRDGIPVYGVELYLKGKQEPQTEKYPTWKQFAVGPEAILWQKEALVNAAARSLPAQVEYLAEVDADLWFDNPNWVEDTITLLQDHDILQPFEAAIWLGPEGEIDRVKPSQVAAGKDSVLWAGHPGFATAWRRDYFEKSGGFYPKAILGGGDHLLWTAHGYGASVEHSCELAGLGDCAEYQAYVSRIRGLNSRVGTPTPGAIHHEFHGTQKNRSYALRGEKLKKYDTPKLVDIHEDGYLVWNKKAPAKLKTMVRDYFPTRKEDD